MDDLAGSIKDGRFHEQKFRLCDSGIANVVYLIESRGHNQHVGLPVQNLLQAATNTQVQSGFAVKFTASLVESMQYLAVMTELLQEMYKVYLIIRIDFGSILTFVCSLLEQIPRRIGYHQSINLLHGRRFVSRARARLLRVRRQLGENAQLSHSRPLCAPTAATENIDAGQGAGHCAPLCDARAAIARILRMRPATRRRGAGGRHYVWTDQEGDRTGNQQVFVSFLSCATGVVAFLNCIIVTQKMEHK